MLAIIFVKNLDLCQNKTFVYFPAIVGLVVGVNIKLHLPPKPFVLKLDFLFLFNTDQYLIGINQCID